MWSFCLLLVFLKALRLLYTPPPPHTKYAEGYIIFVRSVGPFVCLFFCPSVCPSVSLSHSITKFYFEVSFDYITLQPLIKNFSYFVWGYLGGFSSHSTAMDPWVVPQARARGQNLGHPSRPWWLSWMRRPTGDQEVAGSTPAEATFFHGDWSWNIFYCHSLPSADSRRAIVSFWRKNVHNTG